MLKIPKLKFRNQLVLINTFSKVLIILAAIFILPIIVRNLSLNDTDKQLTAKIDKVYSIVDSLGIEEFIDLENADDAFGSYNIFKEEYISVETTTDTILYEKIESTERLIEGEVFEFRVLSATIQFDDKFYLIEIGKSISVIYRFRDEMQKFALYFLLFVLGITIITDVTLTQILLRPFGAIISKLKRTKSPVGFDYTRIKTNTSDFDYLQDSIHNLMEKIETVFKSEREYISNVSHELLTPVSIIQSKLDNLLNDPELPDTIIEKLLDSKLTLGRLTGIVKNLLLISRIENEEYLLGELVSVPMLLHETITVLSDRAEMKGITLQMPEAITDFKYTGNELLLHTMFFNLINNAIKFTPENGAINIVCILSDSKFKVIISNTGEGISAENIPQIFKRFKKFGNSESGYGLGLAIVKKIADYHKIEIEVQSEMQVETRFILKFSIS